MFKKLLISVLSIVLLLTTTLSFFAPNVRAQGTWYNPNLREFSDKVFDQASPDEIFGERYTYAQVVWIFHSLTTIIMPDFILQCMTASSLGERATCITDSLRALNILATNTDTQNPSNLANTINSVFLENPLSGVGYVKEKLTKIKIIPEVKAQRTGFGYKNLEPLQNLWRAVRNIAYFLMILAFIIMAFMIMFRVKISPQTVITVQSALPRLIMVLLLITFSYAIAGFVIDLSYVVLGLFAAMVGLGSGGISGLAPIPLFTALVTVAPINAMFIVPHIVTLVLVLTGSLAIPIVGPQFGLIIIVLAAFLWLIVMVFLLIIWLKILWLMLKTFINITLLVIGAPILILAGVFPASGGFGSWFKNLASHVAVFPVITIMFFLSHFFFWSNLGGGPIGSFMSGLTILNPFEIQFAAVSGQVYLPGFQLGSTSFFGFVAAVGVLTLIPSVGSIIQSAIAGKPFSYGTAIAAPIAAAAGITSYPIRESAGIYTGAQRAAITDILKARASERWETLLRRRGR